MARTYIDKDGVLRVARLPGEVLGAEVGSDEVRLHSTPKLIHVHISDLSGLWGIAGIGNEDVDWTDLVGNVLERDFDIGRFGDVGRQSIETAIRVLR